MTNVLGRYCVGNFHVGAGKRQPALFMNHTTGSPSDILHGDVHITGLARWKRAVTDDVHKGDLGDRWPL